MNEIEKKREDDFRARAIAKGFELLTPAAAAELFGKREPTVRGAARAGYIETVFYVKFSEKHVRLYRLDSCAEYWGKPDEGKLETMRDESLTFWVGHRGGEWIVLHPEPLVTMERAAD